MLNPTRERLPLWRKIAYGLGSANDMWGHWLYPGLAFPVFNIFFGLSPDKVGLALMLIRLIDAVSDPFFGWLSDNTRTRFGRRRPYILAGSILGGIGLPLLFFTPPHWRGMALFWWMLVSNLIYVPLISCFNMPYQSLGAELTPDYHERTSVMSFKGSMQKLFEIAFFVGLPFTNLPWFTDPGTGKQNTLMGVQVYCGILGALMAVIGVILFFSVQERYYDKVSGRSQTRVSLRESFYETLTCRPFLIMLGAGLCFSLGTSMVGSLGYYATVYYVAAGDTISGNYWNGLMGFAYMAGGFLGPILLGMLGQRIGKKRGALAAAVAALAAFGGTWFLYDPSLPWLQLLASGSIAFAAAGFWMFNASIGADIMDYDELQTGKRREGAFSACGSWIMKVGNAAGYYFAGRILTEIGFDASKEAQTPDTIFWIRAMLASIPILGITLAILLLFRLPLTQAMMTEIRAKLEHRRGRV